MDDHFCDGKGRRRLDRLRGRLSPRQRQVLDHLLRGDAEKQIAYKLKISRHTVHVYVKNLYRIFDVNSRGELLALFLAASGYPFGVQQSDAVRETLERLQRRTGRHLRYYNRLRARLAELGGGPPDRVYRAAQQVRDTLLGLLEAVRSALAEGRRE